MFVGIDSHGVNLHEDIAAQARERLARA